MIHLLDNWKGCLDVKLHCTCFSFHQLCDNRVRSFIFTHPALSLTNTPLVFAFFFSYLLSLMLFSFKMPQKSFGGGKVLVILTFPECTLPVQFLVSSCFASKETL